MVASSGSLFHTGRNLFEGAFMARVVVSSEIQHYIPCPPQEVFGQTLKEILEGYFRQNRTVRDYILDGEGCLRPGLAVFVDGVMTQDRTSLNDPIHLQANVFIFSQLHCHESY
jgi:hypothetical protein